MDTAKATRVLEEAAAASSPKRARIARITLLPTPDKMPFETDSFYTRAEYETRFGERMDIAVGYRPYYLAKDLTAPGQPVVFVHEVSLGVDITKGTINPLVVQNTLSIMAAQYYLGITTGLWEKVSGVFRRLRGVFGIMEDGDVALVYEGSLYDVDRHMARHDSPTPEERGLSTEQIKTGTPNQDRHREGYYPLSFHTIDQLDRLHNDGKDIPEQFRRKAPTFHTTTQLFQTAEHLLKVMATCHGHHLTGIVSDEWWKMNTLRDWDKLEMYSWGDGSVMLPQRDFDPVGIPDLLITDFEDCWIPALSHVIIEELGELMTNRVMRDLFGPRHRQTYWEPELRRIVGNITKSRVMDQEVTRDFQGISCMIVQLARLGYKGNSDAQQPPRWSYTHEMDDDDFPDADQPKNRKYTFFGHQTPQEAERKFGWMGTFTTRHKRTIESNSLAPVLKKLLDKAETPEDAIKEMWALEVLDVKHE